ELGLVVVEHRHVGVDALRGQWIDLELDLHLLRGGGGLGGHPRLVARARPVQAIAGAMRNWYRRGSHDGTCGALRAGRWARRLPSLAWPDPLTGRGAPCR